MFTILTSTFILTFFVTFGSTVKTCTNPLDYFNPFATSCVNDTDGGATPTQILERWNCTVIEHTLITDEGGYEFSIIEAYGNEDPTKNPVILYHGIATNCRVFVSSGENSLAYRLLKVGYRIYLVNFRGTLYSLKNVNNLTDNNIAYWNFSFHHLGLNEVRQSINLVNTITLKKSVLIGYSMGSTACTVYLTKFPKDAETKVKGAILMAPVIYMNNIPSAFRTFAPLWPFFRLFFEKICNGKVFPRNENQIAFCRLTPFNFELCNSIKGPFFGWNNEGIDTVHFPVQATNNPDVTGIGCIDHYYQVIVSGMFREFDYGPKGNLEVYNSTIPLKYNLSEINVVISIYVGEGDYLSTPENAKACMNDVSPAYRGNLTIIPSWDHTDFAIDKNQLAVNDNITREVGNF